MNDPHPAAWCSSLITRGLLTAEAVERALRIAAETRTPLSAVLTRLGLAGESSVADALAESLALPVLPRQFLQIDPAPPDDLNRQFLLARKLLPVVAQDGQCIVAMANPLDEEALAGVAYAYGRPLPRAVALESDVDDALRAAEPVQSEPVPSVGAVPDLQEEALLLADQSSEAPVIRLVNRLIAKARGLRASDIHVEPGADALYIRFRVDGELGAAEVLARQWAEPVVSRMKLMAKLDIAEKRVPQDGRLRAAVQGHAIDLRLATFPTLHGESLVLRLLGQETVALELDRVGLSPSGLATLRHALAQPHGLVLMTGPTGSGKTTTLYAALNELRRPELKLVTVEDPIEYTLPGVSQLQVKPDIGLDFPAALRSVLRNDPDVIMVGEIRDKETADIAIRAALTGHLVLATLHTNTAAGAVTRLLDLGVEEFLLSSTLEATCAQRLVRRLCKQCARRRAATADELSLFLAENAFKDREAGEVMLSDAVGCAACLGRGYSGRTPLFEAIGLSEAARRLIRPGFQEAALRALASDEEGQTVLQHGLQKVLAHVCAPTEF